MHAIRNLKEEEGRRLGSICIKKNEFPAQAWTVHGEETNREQRILLMRQERRIQNETN